MLKHCIQRTASHQVTLFLYHIDSTNLKFLGFSNPSIWNLDRFFTGELLQRARKLPKRKQWLLIESLDPNISHFEFFLSNGGLKKYEWDDVKLLEAFGKISNCIWGWPGEILYDSDMNRIEIFPKGLEVLKLIEKFPRTALGLLPLGWETSELISVLRDLQHKRVLLLKPSQISTA